MHFSAFITFAAFFCVLILTSSSARTGKRPGDPHERQCTEENILLELDYSKIPCFGFYKVHTLPQSWDKAKERCELEDTHLAIIETQKEAYVLERLLRKHPTGAGAKWDHIVWVGFHQFRANGQPILTVKDELFNTSVVWSYDPKVAQQGTAGLLLRDGNGFQYSSREYGAAFICEREL